MFCALLTSRNQVSVYRTNGPLVLIYKLHRINFQIKSKFYNDSQLTISVSGSPKNRIEQSVTGVQRRTEVKRKCRLAS